MSELLPCPFCGGEAVRCEFDPADPFKPFGLIVDHTPDCWLKIAPTGDDDAVAAAWNRRADPERAWCACGDSHTNESVCANCLAAESDGAPEIGTRYRDDAGKVVAMVVPASITAETGHKAAMMSEFSVTATDCCYSCEGAGSDENDDDCPTCDGSGEVGREIGVPWTTLKEIHRTMLATIPEPSSE